MEHSNQLNKYDIFKLVNIKPPVIYRTMTTIIELLGRIPVISILFKPFFYIWSMIIGMVIALIKKKVDTLIYILPSILSIGLLLITPDVEFRYVLPIVYLVPIIYAYIMRK